MAMTLIETYTVSGSPSIITIDQIPQTYTDLLFVYSLRTSRTASAFEALRFLVNGAATNTDFRILFGNGSAVATQTKATDAFLAATTNGNVGTSNTFSNGSLYISNYAGSANKPMSIDNVTENNTTEAYQNITAMIYSSSTAITSIGFETYATNAESATFLNNGTISLYGLS